MCLLLIIDNACFLFPFYCLNILIKHLSEVMDMGDGSSFEINQVYSLADILYTCAFHPNSHTHFSLFVCFVRIPITSLIIMNIGYIEEHVCVTPYSADIYKMLKRNRPYVKVM